MEIRNNRIFLAINLSDKIKNRLMRIQEEWPDLPVRWTKKENLHITLIFIGSVNNEEMIDVCNLSKNIASQESCFEIKLNKICFGPLSKNPRMIWAMGENNKGLSCLKNNLEMELFDSNKDVQVDNRVFRPHITLARIKHKEWNKMAKLPDIEKDISLTFLVDSVQVMKSYLSKKGPEYTVLESILLK